VGLPSPNRHSESSVPYPPFARLILTQIQHFDIFRTMKSNDAINSLAALAQGSRLAIFRILVKRGPEGYTPTQLGEKLNVSSPTLSFHLKELQRAGLVDVRRDGRFLFYRPNFAHMNQLIEFLTENCCVLADQSCGAECGPVPAEALPKKRKRA
jgi:ArsR family transcriptional regulator, arsenate/arsenite/antimonite-responsive transcriptional repressor